MGVGLLMSIKASRTILQVKLPTRVSAKLCQVGIKTHCNSFLIPILQHHASLTNSTKIANSFIEIPPQITWSKKKPMVEDGWQQKNGWDGYFSSDSQHLSCEQPCFLFTFLIAYPTRNSVVPGSGTSISTWTPRGGSQADIMQHSAHGMLVSSQSEEKLDTTCSVWWASNWTTAIYPVA